MLQTERIGLKATDRNGNRVAVLPSLRALHSLLKHTQNFTLFKMTKKNRDIVNNVSQMRTQGTNCSKYKIYFIVVIQVLSEEDV